MHTEMNISSIFSTHQVNQYLLVSVLDCCNEIHRVCHCNEQLLCDKIYWHTGKAVSCMGPWLSVILWREKIQSWCGQVFLSLELEWCTRVPGSPHETHG